MGSGKHKAGSGKQSAASEKRKGTDGFRYHEAKHRGSQQWKRKVGNGQFKVTGEQWTGGTVSPLNGDLSSCRCSRENDSLPCCDVPPASCKISAGRTIQNSVERVIWSRVLHYLSDFKIRSLFCALLETEKTLLCVIEMRKGPFRVRRPGARIALFPRRD